MAPISDTKRIKREMYLERLITLLSQPYQTKTGKKLNVENILIFYNLQNGSQSICENSKI